MKIIALAILMINSLLAFGNEAKVINYDKFKEEILASKFGKIDVGVDKLTSVENKIGAPKLITDIGVPYKDSIQSVLTAQRPLLKYGFDSNWCVFIYAIKSNLSEIGGYDSSLYENVGSIDFLPTKRIKLEFDSTKYVRKEIYGENAAWVDFIDENITISIYSAKPQYGTKEKGNVNRISIKPDKKYRRIEGSHKLDSK